MKTFLESGNKISRILNPALYNQNILILGTMRLRENQFTFQTVNLGRHFAEMNVIN
jgi:hypothetical protein